MVFFSTGKVLLFVSFLVFVFRCRDICARVFLTMALGCKCIKGAIRRTAEFLLFLLFLAFGTALLPFSFCYLFECIQCALEKRPTCCTYMVPVKDAACEVTKF